MSSNVTHPVVAEVVVNPFRQILQTTVSHITIFHPETSVQTDLGVTLYG